MRTRAVGARQGEREEPVEIVAGELPGKRFGNLLVTLLEGQEAFSQSLKVGEVIWREDLALNYREVDLDLALSQEACTGRRTSCKLGQEERSLSGSELRERLGVSRQRLGQLRGEKKLLGLRLPIRREVYYPLWQFDVEGKPLGIMPRLIEAAEEAGVSALALDALMTNPEAVYASGETPAELLRSGDPAAEEYILGVVRAALSGGA